GSGAAAAGPLTVRSASFTLVGQKLVWNARLSGPFTAAGLAQQHQTLCLLIESSTNVVTERICLKPGRGGSALVLSYKSRQRTVAATVTRPTATTLRAAFLPGAIGQRNRNFVFQTQATAPGSAT